MYYILPETAITGIAMCGVMVCGVFGYYSNVPEDPYNPGYPVIPGDPYFPPEETIELYAKIGDQDVYPLKGSLSWEESAGEVTNTCSFTIGADLVERPLVKQCVKISIGTPQNVLFAGILQRVSEKWLAGSEDDANLTFEYNCSAVGLDHVLLRKFVSDTFKEMTCGDIIKELIEDKAKGLKVGTVEDGEQIEKIKFENESISDIFAALVKKSEYTSYIDEDRRFHFLPKDHYKMKTQFTLGDAWTYGGFGSWDFLRNNYNNLSIEWDGSQIITRVVVHGSRLVKYQVNYYDPYSDGYATCGRYSDEIETFPMTETQQKSFFTTHKIYSVDLVYASWVQEFEEDVADEIRSALGGDPDDRLGAKSTPGYYMNRTWVSTGLGEGYYDYETKVTDTSGRSTQSFGTLDEDEEEPVVPEILDVHILCFWEPPVIKDEEYAHDGYTWNPKMYKTEDWSSLSSQVKSFWGFSAAGMDKSDMFSWNLRPEDEGRTETEEEVDDEEAPLGGTQTREEEEKDFVWNVSYDSNRVAFSQEAPINFKFVSIVYNVVEDYTYEITDWDKAHEYEDLESCIVDSDGIFEMHYENREILTKEVAVEYAEEVLKYRSSPRMSGSYVHYKRGLDVVNERLRAGMVQTVAIRGRDPQDLVIESIRFSLKKGASIPIFQLDI